MIELIIKDYLAETLALPVLLETPASPPRSYVQLERTGGGDRGRLCTAMIAVQSYGPTMLDAADLNESVKTAMRGLAQLPQICRVEHNTSYNFTDPDTKRYRYQAVFDIIYYQEE